MENKKLVAYFSCGGETAEVAKLLAKVAGAELFRIKPAVPYTEADLDWHDKDSRTSVEMRTMIAPEIAEKVENMELYDTVFIGFPIWWYLAPTIINGFLASYDFTGKTIVPFATSGGSDMAKAEAVLQTKCKTAVWKPGKMLGENTGIDELKAWLEEIDER